MDRLAGFVSEPQWAPAVSTDLAATNDQPAKRRAFSYTEMMNSGQQQLSAEQIAALEKQTKEVSKQNDNPPTTKP